MNPWARRNDNSIGADRASRYSETLYLDAAKNPDTYGLCFSGKCIHGASIVGVSAFLFMKYRCDALRLPVRNGLSYRHHWPLHRDKRRGVVILLFVIYSAMFSASMHDQSACNRQMIAEGFGIAVPYCDGVHEFAHRRLIVIVAHHPTCNSGSSGCYGCLVDDENIGSGALPLEFRASAR